MNTQLHQQLYLRYYVGHRGRHGHEFLEFEVRPDGLLRYANNSNYRHEAELIRKECRVGALVMRQLAEMVLEGGIIGSSIDDSIWPPPNDEGRQELEVIIGGQHVNFATRRFGSIVEVGQEETLRSFYHLVQDLKRFVLALIAAHFKIKPIIQ